MCAGTFSTALESMSSPSSATKMAMATFSRRVSWLDDLSRTRLRRSGTILCLDRGLRLGLNLAPSVLLPRGRSVLLLRARWWRLLGRLRLRFLLLLVVPLLVCRCIRPWTLLFKPLPLPLLPPLLWLWLPRLWLWLLLLLPRFFSLPLLPWWLLPAPVLADPFVGSY